MSTITASGTLYFGDGSDGDVTLSSNVTVAKDMYYNNLDVGGFSLNANGWKIFVKDTLTMGGGKIHFNGNSASGRTGGAALVANTLGRGAAGTNGISTGGSYGGQSIGDSLGGSGGSGGASSTITSFGNGGTANGLNALNGGSHCVTSLPHCLTMRAPNSGTIIQGGASGAAGTPSINNGTFGGGGGGGGGVVLVSANVLSGTGTLEARGGDGGVGTSNGINGAGGGGGGGGGAVVLISTTDPSTTGISVDVSGGPGGSGGTNAQAGNSGTSGSTVTIVV